jgi:hypothetical protein
MPIDTMNETAQKIPEWHNVDAAMFASQILTQYRPAVLRGVVRHWPAVHKALQSPQTICGYLKRFDTGVDVNAIMTPPAAKGHIGYSDDLREFSFVRNRLPLSAVIDQLQRYLGADHAPSLAAQSAMISESIPGFLNENRLALLDDSVLPRIWLGNRITVPAHFDEAHNIACCVSGRRRFTLFPPEQVANLYVGPLDFTPAGAPVSLASGSQPDLARFPRFREALAASMVAELEPGDAIYIPAIWWHQVESIGALNILVNYWWGGPTSATDRSASPSTSLTHSLLTIGRLDPQMKQAWKAVFNHFLFNDADPAAHLPDYSRGILGQLSDAEIRKAKDALIAQLQK